MGFVSFLILLVVVGFGTVKLNRALRQRQQAQSSLPGAAPATAAPVAQSNGLDSWLTGTIAKLRRQPVAAPMAPAFRLWVETALSNDAKLQAWLLSLSPEQLEVLVEHIMGYCDQLKVKLTWLTARQLDVAPALKQSTQEIVIAYCTGIWKATQIKTKLDLFNEYQQLTQPNLQQPQQILQRELLASLAAHELVAAQPLAATLTGTAAEQQAKAVQAIQQAATADWERFAAILQATVSQNGVQLKKEA